MTALLALGLSRRATGRDKMRKASRTFRIDNYRLFHRRSPPNHQYPYRVAFAKLG
jgi:hypothetical protein